MVKKQFKAESKRLLDLMIHSIYTHKEIFLRELISNASDALDKLAYLALTDDKVGLNRSDFQITIVPDKEKRTLTISDNGIGMSKDELEANLGTIAKSGSLQFKQDMEQKADTDIIGQFGVGFYSAFMVADLVSVTSKAYGAQEAWCWQSQGADGYTLSPAQKDSAGTQIVMHILEDSEEECYSPYLEEHRLAELIRKYSDYIRYPIRMEMEHQHLKESSADEPDGDKDQYETHTEWETLNSRIPLWHRPKAEVKDEEYSNFYKEKYGDWEPPLSVIHVSAEGQVEYRAMLFLPGKAPYDFYTREFQKGLQLYSSGVLIMEKCADLLPDCFRFVRGVVDSQDFSLNISREILQHTRVLQVIAANLEKKIKTELLRLQKEERETYEQFWTAFGRQLKYGVMDNYGAQKELLKELLLFPSSKKDGGLTSFAEYKERMSPEQPFIYYACGENTAQLEQLPQAERIHDKGYEILYLTEESDEFIMNALGEWDGKPFKSIADGEALPQSQEEKDACDKIAQENKDVLSFVKETLGDQIKEARISKILKSAAVCLSADGPISLDMERYFIHVEPDQAQHMKAQHILELNPDSAPFAALRTAVDQNKELAASYTKLLYQQARLIAGLPIEDPTQYTQLVCALMK